MNKKIPALFLLFSLSLPALATDTGFGELSVQSGVYTFVIGASILVGGPNPPAAIAAGVGAVFMLSGIGLYITYGRGGSSRLSRPITRPFENTSDWTSDKLSSSESDREHGAVLQEQIKRARASALELVQTGSADIVFSETVLKIRQQAKQYADLDPAIQYVAEKATDYELATAIVALF